MSIETEIDDRGFVVVKPVGKNSVEDYVEAFRALRRDKTSREINKVLFDTTGIEVSLSNKDIANLTGMVSGGHDPSKRKVAVLVQSSLKYGLTRMFMSLADEESFQIFSGIDDAAVWLTEEPC